MKNLFFVKFEGVTRTPHAGQQIVFLFTAETAEAAGARGVACIAEHCREHYRLVETTLICVTPDTVECFEPC